MNPNRPSMYRFAMRQLTSAALCALSLLMASFAALAQAPPAETRTLLPVAELSGSAKLTVWGFEVYNAALWVEPGFRPETYVEHEFCLELTYLRDFTNEDIANRSIEEMRRMGEFSPAQAQRWQKLLQASYPDVKKGDRIVGVNRPGKGMVFFTNGLKTGEITDPELTRLFFGIWLAPTTSEPRLRQALLARKRS